VLAAAIGVIAMRLTAASALPIVITPALAASLFVVTAIMCVGSAVISILRVIRTDPVMVLTR
jgi:putative ABC transport system permease protein